MATRKQLAANRANARKSTGPQTEAGKNRSRLNATRHGLTGQVSIMTEEDSAAREAFTAPIIASFQPKTPYETQLAQAIATCHWRINRAATLEENILTLATAEDNPLPISFENPQVTTAFAHAVAYLDDQRSFDRLSLYTNRLTNQAAKHLKELKQLQADRKALEAQALADAAILYKFHEMQNLPFNPAANGFVLATAEIRTHVHRENLRQLARETVSAADNRPHTTWNPGKRAA